MERPLKFQGVRDFKNELGVHNLGEEGEILKKKLCGKEERDKKAAVKVRGGSKSIRLRRGYRYMGIVRSINNIMKILSYNVRPLGEAAKKKEVSHVIRINNHDLIDIQETKLVEVEGMTCENMWRLRECDYIYKATKLISEELLMMWNAKYSQCKQNC